MDGVFHNALDKARPRLVRVNVAMALWDNFYVSQITSSQSTVMLQTESTVIITSAWSTLQLSKQKEFHLQ